MIILLILKNNENMAYKNINRLRRIIEIQNITLEHTQKGITQEWVYKNIIYPRFFISRATYYRYLAEPAKRKAKMS